MAPRPLGKICFCSHELHPPRLQGIFIKLGQHLAQLEHLLPSQACRMSGGSQATDRSNLSSLLLLQYTNTLRCMLHAAPQDPFSAVEAVFAAGMLHAAQ